MAALVRVVPGLKPGNRNFFLLSYVDWWHKALKLTFSAFPGYSQVAGEAAGIRTGVHLRCWLFRLQLILPYHSAEFRQATFTTNRCVQFCFCLFFSLLNIAVLNNEQFALKENFKFQILLPYDTWIFHIRIKHGLIIQSNIFVSPFFP